MSIISEVHTEKDDEFRKWIDRIYKKAVLPIQINASSATYKIFREYIKSKYDDYEDAKKKNVIKSFRIISCNLTYRTTSALMLISMRQ